MAKLLSRLKKYIIINMQDIIELSSTWNTFYPEDNDETLKYLKKEKKNQ